MHRPVAAQSAQDSASIRRVLATRLSADFRMEGAGSTAEFRVESSAGYWSRTLADLIRGEVQELPEPARDGWLQVEVFRLRLEGDTARVIIRMTRCRGDRSGWEADFRYGAIRSNGDWAAIRLEYPPGTMFRDIWGCEPDRAPNTRMNGTSAAGW